MAVNYDTEQWLAACVREEPKHYTGRGTDGACSEKQNPGNDIRREAVKQVSDSDWKVSVNKGSLNSNRGFL